MVFHKILVRLCQPICQADFKQTQGAHAAHIGGVFGAFKTDGHMALGAQVVDFVKLRLLNDAHQVAGVAQVAIVQLEVGVAYMRVLVNVVHPLGVE